MLHKQTCEDVILGFQKKHKLIAPDTDSLAIAKELWQEWERSGTAPPNINEVAKEYAKHENGFFYELVKVAEKLGNTKLNIHYCQFSLDRYNAYAFSAKDGYIVLVDDVFFQILFFLCNILVFDSMDAIESDAEKEEVKQLVDRIIHVNYFSRQRIDFSQESVLHKLLKRDYELAEFANYLFNSLKAFIISHEIGHHILNHTSNTITKIFAANGNSVVVEVDKRSLALEFEADDYGYKLFDALSNTTDDSVYYAYCKYKFTFAPIILFDLFHRLDLLQEKLQNKAIVYNEHPHPSKRIKILRERYKIDNSDPLYLQLKASLNNYLR